MRTAAAQTRPCPICGKPAGEAHRPFCSPRCKQVDLGRWFGGHYRVESDDPPEGSEGLRDED